jgi:predicted permease
VPGLDTLSVNGSALAFSSALVLLTGVLFGLAPALHSIRYVGERGSVSSRGTQRTRHLLLAGEVAVSVLLLTGAGLLVRSLWLLGAADPGFNPDNVLTMTVSVAGREEFVGESRRTFYRQVVDGAAALPGVESVALVNHLPIGGDLWYTTVHGEGMPLPAPGAEIQAAYRVASPGYLRTIGARLLEGRDFDSRDSAAGARVAIVNRRLAVRLWRDSSSALGKRISVGGGRDAPVWLIVVGVVGNIRQRSWHAEVDNEIYLPIDQMDEVFTATHPARTYLTVVARTWDDPLLLAGAVQKRIWALHPDVPISAVRSLRQVADASLWQWRAQAAVLGAFALFATVLAALGLYGVIAYAVSGRTQEIGVRLALGARASAVAWMIVREGMALAGAGVAIGTAAALLLSRSLASLLYGVSARDPLTFISVPVLLAVVAAAASYLPARRATRIEPAAALRSA